MSNKPKLNYPHGGKAAQPVPTPTDPLDGLLESCRVYRDTDSGLNMYWEYDERKTEALVRTLARERDEVRRLYVEVCGEHLRVENTLRTENARLKEQVQLLTNKILEYSGSTNRDLRQQLADLQQSSQLTIQTMEQQLAEARAALPRTCGHPGHDGSEGFSCPECYGTGLAPVPWPDDWTCISRADLANLRQQLADSQRDKAELYHQYSDSQREVERLRAALGTAAKQSMDAIRKLADLAGGGR